ncbi:hypothetical protein SCA6_020357 [Theobroma cacao]
MGDSEHSSSGDTFVDSREVTSRESKVKFSDDEETLIIRMYNLVGERLDSLLSLSFSCFLLLALLRSILVRWALIAGRIPGRTAKEIEEYWNTRCSTSE